MFFQKISIVVFVMYIHIAQKPLQTFPMGQMMNINIHIAGWHNTHLIICGLQELMKAPSFTTKKLQ
jgi:hypothetical protein